MNTVRERPGPLRDAPEPAARTGNPRGVVAYLLLTFGLAWGVWIPLWALGIPPTSPLGEWAFVSMAFAPALAALAVRGWITREGFADAGMRPRLRDAWPYYLCAWLYPLLLLGAAITLAVVVSVPVDLGVLRSVPAGLLGALVMTPLLWCEEFGWRSYLQIRLFRARPLLAAVSTGAIWGVWHYPAVLAGQLPNEHGLVGVLAYAWYMIPFSIILGWLRVRSGSIWPPSLAHAANNMLGPLIPPALLLTGGQGDLLFDPRGLLVLIPLAILCVGIVVSGQLQPVQAGSRHPGARTPVGAQG